MKKLLTVVLFLSTVFAFSQQASKVNNAQNVQQSVANPIVLLGALPSPVGDFQVYIKNDIRWETYNINNLANYIKSVGDTLYVSDTTPIIVDWDDVDNKPAFFDGDYNSLTNQPTIPTNTNQLTNGAGFVTTSGVTSIGAGTGLDGGTITTTGTLSLNSATQSSLVKADSALQGVAVATTSSATYTVSPTTNLYMVTFTGTTSTFTLPNVASFTGLTLYIINDGSGVITIESEDIWEGGLDLDEMEVPQGTIIRFVCDGIKFRAI